MRKLTEAQQRRIEHAMWNAEYRGNLECRALDDVWIEGWLSLVQLRLLINRLIDCHYENEDSDDDLPTGPSLDRATINEGESMSLVITMITTNTANKYFEFDHSGFDSFIGRAYATLLELVVAVSARLEERPSVNVHYVLLGAKYYVTVFPGSKSKGPFMDD